MYCPNCGKNNLATAKFCKNCGGQLINQAATKSKKRFPWTLLIALLGALFLFSFLLFYRLRKLNFSRIRGPLKTNTLGPAPLTQLPSTKTVIFPGTSTVLSPTQTYTPKPSATLIPSITPSPTKGIGSTQVSPLDDMVMVYVPAGEFMMGSGMEDDDNSPLHTVYMDAYWIDQTEVTNVMFAKFVDETGYITQAEKDGWSWDYHDSKWYKTSGADWRHPDGPDSSIGGLEDHPVIRVSWDDAQAYCSWAGRRLPTEAEWEKAARGKTGVLYPWGNGSPSASLLNFNSNIGTTTPVGSYPLSPSPYGVLDMAGNVWEWVADRYAKDYYSNSPYENPLGPKTGQGRGMRGGSWVWGEDTVRVTYREWGRQDESYWSTGFRCAMQADN